MDYKRNDNWKWSVYAKKTIAEYYYISAQFASDHLRTFSLDWQGQDLEEALRKPKHWYFMVRLGLQF
jgi:hypothetical protein